VADDQGQDPDRQPDPYQGPAVLTRAYTLPGPQLGGRIHWQLTAGAAEVYDTGNSSIGQGTNNGRFGPQFSWGLTGRQIWRRESLALSYSGSYNSYPAQNLRGLNQSLAMNYTRLLKARLLFNLGVNGSSLSQGYSLENPVTNPSSSLANVNIAVSPIVQLFDTTTRQISFSPSIRWQKSARLSFSATGSWFGVDREGFGLIGQSGFQATGDMNYRVTRRITTGAYYSATFYQYSHGFSMSDSHAAGGLLSIAFGRSTQLRTRGGVGFFESLGLTQVQIDPALAALLGTQVGVIDQYRLKRFAEGSIELAHDLHRGKTFTLSYTRGIAPGNGLILASFQEAAGAGYSMRLLHRYTLSTGLQWSSLNSGNSLQGKYVSDGVYLGLSRPVARQAEGNLRFDFRRFTIQNAQQQPNLTPVEQTPNQIRVSLGLTWSSSEAGLLHLW
jgi:hypothetical protein